jgi:hypothetical protein
MAPAQDMCFINSFLLIKTALSSKDKNYLTTVNFSLNVWFIPSNNLDFFTSIVVGEIRIYSFDFNYLFKSFGIRETIAQNKMYIFTVSTGKNVDIPKKSCASKNSERMIVMRVHLRWHNSLLREFFLWLWMCLDFQTLECIF